MPGARSRQTRGARPGVGSSRGRVPLGVSVVTIHDVAAAAGVSTATVSRVLNGSPRVSDDTREKVLAAAAQLDYWPNGAARSLTTSRTNALGVLLPDLFGEFFSEIIRGIDHAAGVEQMQILVSSSHANADQLLSASRALRGRIDGLIAMALDKGSAAAARQISRNFPVVLLNAASTNRQCSTVALANFDGAYAMVQHLLALGHRRIAMVKGPPGNIDAAERYRAYRQALVDAGLDPDEMPDLSGDFTETAGYQSAAVLLRLTERPTAVFAANDYMAVGLLGALRQAGVEVPKEIAVVGFDDITISQYLTPALTTVHVDAYELGQQAVRRLLTALRTPGARPTHEVLPTRLVVRASCGSPTPFSTTTSLRRRRGIRILPGRSEDSNSFDNDDNESSIVFTERRPPR